MNQVEKLNKNQEKLPQNQIFSNTDIKKIKIIYFLFAILKFWLPNSKVNRFEKSLKFYLGIIELDENDYNPQQKPKEFLYLGLTSKPWYKADDYEIFKKIADTLKKGAKDIQNEWMTNISNKSNIISRYETSDLYPSLNSDDWGKVMLWKNGHFTKEGMALFPKTVNILSQLQNYIIPFGEAVFLVLKPGVALPPHHDDSNIDITCHLGLKIPDNCAIRVGEETRNWVEGETLFFDHSFEHEVWNKSQNERVVLLLDLYHPELTKIERLLLWVFAKAVIDYR